MRLFQNINIDFMGKRKFFYIISASILVLGLLSIIFRGLEFGIDFKGGTEIVLQFEKPISISDVRDDLSGIGLGDIEVKTFGGETGVLVSTELTELPPEIFPKMKENMLNLLSTNFPTSKFELKDTSANTLILEFANPDTAGLVVERLIALGFQAGRVPEDLTNRKISTRIAMADWIEESISAKFVDNPFTVIREEKVGPKVGSELKVNTLIAVVLSLLTILLYLGFRYKFVFAFGAVLALFHDVLITLGLYAIFYGLIPGLNLEINLTIVAAFLTLIGYSINDTVVIFDRLRETIKIHKTETLYNLLNQGINKTLSRTILTGGMTILTITVLLIFGGDVLRAFAFTLLFGIIIGTYSSIFVASAMVYDYATKYKKKIEF